MLGSVLVEGGMTKGFSRTKSQKCYRVLLDMHKMNGIASSPTWKAVFDPLYTESGQVSKDCQ